jgi:hypothetical protein
MPAVRPTTAQPLELGLRVDEPQSVGPRDLRTTTDSCKPPIRVHPSSQK